MLPTSHSSPTSSPPLPPFSSSPARNGGEGGALALADAFSAFIAASDTLERSYRELQGEVAALGEELAARNAALEASLHENEQMRLALVALVDAMPCGVLVLGPEGAIERMNPESFALLELSAAAEAFESLDGSVEGAPRDLAALEQCSGVELRPFATLVGESELSFVPRGGGERRWIGLRTRRFADAGEQTRTILVLRDISAHKQAEQEREAGRRAVALAEVAATLAHEIRNPLASLELFTDLLEAEPERTRDWLGHLRAGLRVLGSTVGNVLAMQAREALHLRPMRLARAIGAAAEFVRPVAEQAGVRLTVCCTETDGGEPDVRANESALQQAVLNLVTNAVRHTPAGGEVRIAVLGAGSGESHIAKPRCGTPTVAAGAVCNGPVLEVVDTGCGIAPEHLGMIFEAGWSADGGSTGLGLAVCRRIAAQHGAVLTAGPRVDGEPVSGACFRMEFPCL